MNRLCDTKEDGNICIGICKRIRQEHWNRLLKTYNNKERKYTTPSLYDACKLIIRENYKYDWNEITKYLPPIIQKDFLKDWLQTSQNLPFVNACEDKREQEMFQKVINYNPFAPQRHYSMPTEIFLGLMTFPDDEIPEFAYSENHIQLKYFIQKQGNTIPNQKDDYKKGVCEYCFYNISNYNAPYSGNVWKENNVRWYEIQDHQVFAAEDLLEDCVWLETNWCSQCLTEPLFIVVSRHDCQIGYKSHTLCQSFWDDSSNSDVPMNEWLNYYTYKQIAPRCVTDNMYTYIKQNSKDLF